MKNHFYMGYSGNKRNEAKDIFNSINFKGIKAVIEPFCGSSAMSYYISLNKKGLKYILNDNNKYLKEMYEIIIDDTKVEKFETEFNILVLGFHEDKKKYNELIKKDNVMSWFIKNKIYCIRAGLFPPSTRKYKETLSLKEYPIFDFYRNNDITFLNIDGIECYKKYKDEKHNLILLDPPYINSCNDFYLDAGLNIYEYLYNNKIENEKAKIFLILENIWIIKLLFNKNKTVIEYDKVYQTNKRKTSHVVIKNM
jgi:16S rRNA G966 N2-methylase RsmD